MVLLACWPAMYLERSSLRSDELHLCQGRLEGLSPGLACEGRAPDPLDVGRLGSERFFNQVGHGLLIDPR